MKLLWKRTFVLDPEMCVCVLIDNLFLLVGVLLIYDLYFVLICSSYKGTFTRCHDVKVRKKV